MANDDVIDMGFTQTPGKMLHIAREEKRLSINAVAAKLRLSAQRVIDLENDEYHNDAVFFVRGHLRSYARIVDIPEQEILQSFEALGYKKQPSCIESSSLQPASMHHLVHAHKIRHMLLWLSASVAVVFILLVIIWWQGQDKSSVQAIITKAPSIKKNIATKKSITTVSNITSQPTAQVMPQSLPPMATQTQIASATSPEPNIAEIQPKQKTVALKLKSKPMRTHVYHVKMHKKNNAHVLKPNYKIIPVQPNDE